MMNLFENLQSMRESKDMTLNLDCRYLTDDEVQSCVEEGKEKYNVDLDYNIEGQFNDVTVSGSPENVRNWINDVYGDWKDIVGSQELADEYDDYYWYEVKEKYFNYYPNATEKDFINYVNDVGASIVLRANGIGESSIMKDEKDMEHVVENIELKTFSDYDWHGWQGALNFPDGEDPMIAEGNAGTLIVGGEDGNKDGVCISVYFGEDIDHWGFKTYNDKESAIKDAKILARLLDDEVDEAQLKRFGFEIVA